MQAGYALSRTANTCGHLTGPGRLLRTGCNFPVSQRSGSGEVAAHAGAAHEIPMSQLACCAVRARGHVACASPGSRNGMCYQQVMRSILSAALLTLALVGACSAPAQSGPPVTGGTSPITTPPATGGTETPAAEAFGAECSDTKACASGLTCATYYGIAGPSGPAFHSCEIACGPDKPQCPGATTCVTIADGPGMVCRPKGS